MSRMMFSTTRDPSRSRPTGSSFKVPRLWRTARLTLGRADDQEKPASAGTGHLGPRGTCTQRFLDHTVDPVVRDT